MKPWLLRERLLEELSFFRSWKMNILTSVFHPDSLIPNLTYESAREQTSDKL